MEVGWDCIRVDIWRNELLPCLSLEFLSLRLVNKSTKAVVDQALVRYLEILKLSYPSDSELRYIESIRYQLEKNKQAARSCLLNLKRVYVPVYLSIRSPNRDLLDFSCLLCKLGHNESKPNWDWSDAQWLFRNFDLFFDQLLTFESSRLRSVVEVLEIYSEGSVGITMWVYQFLRHYKAGCELMSGEYRAKEEMIQRLNKLIGCLGKLIAVIL